MNKSSSPLETFLQKKKLAQHSKDLMLRTVAPEYFVEQKLIALQKANEIEKAYTDTVENYLQRQREGIIDEINTALLRNVKTDFEDNNLSRIVRAKFSNDPLCSFGSVRMPPGGRFNFGQSTRGTTNYFQALYLGNNYETAFQESYHSKEESPGDFAHVKVSAKIDRYLDLRCNKAIDDFFNVVKTIQLPKELRILARQLGVEPMSLVTNANELKATIFSEKYKAWDTWVDQFSTSQWLGFYTYSLSVPAIIYPSVRNELGFNLAIYMDNFKDTDNKVWLTSPDDWDHIPEKRKYINSDNHLDLQTPLKGT